MRPDTVSPHVHCSIFLFPVSYIHFLKPVVIEALFDVLCRMLFSVKTVRLENVKYDEKMWVVIVTPVIENQILKNDIKTKKKYDWHVFPQNYLSLIELAAKKKC